MVTMIAVPTMKHRAAITATSKLGNVDSSCTVKCSITASAEQFDVLHLQEAVDNPQLNQN